MPLTKIHIAKGETKDFIKKFMEILHKTLTEVIMIPENDRNQILAEYDQEYFITKPPYKYFIEITMFAGRKKETKSKLYIKIVENLQAGLSIDPKSVFIIVYEPPLENWGVRGGLSASDINIGFDIKV